MKYYFYKLLPPRPNFMTTMTSAEQEIMQKHAAYWRTLMDEGKVIAYGPVDDPSGGYGIGIVKLDDTADPAALSRNDPAILANAGFRSEINPMLRIVLPE
jgi:uncharacterized protein